MHAPDVPCSRVLPMRQGAAPTGTLLKALWLCGLLVFGAVAVQRTRRRQRAARPVNAQRVLQTWEGEGGRTDDEPAPSAAVTTSPPLEASPDRDSCVSVAGEEDPGAALDQGRAPRRVG